MTSTYTLNTTSSYSPKSPAQTLIDINSIDKHISKLNDDVINRIKENANIDNSYESSIFRPKPDLAMLLFKKDRKSQSIYTLNLLTLKPTINSSNKTELSEILKSEF